MKQVLVYGDSLSWGIVPDTRERFPFGQRWPGLLENGLVALGVPCRVIEDCLNGRRTAWEDPLKPGRNGREGLAQRIEIHSPLDLVVLFLGTNDFQCMHANGPADSARGIQGLIDEIRSAPIEPTMRPPKILVVAPPRIQKAKGLIAAKFAGAETRAQGLNEAMEAVARAQGCPFFDAASVTATSRVDGVHLDQDQHLALGRGLLPVVQALLETPPLPDG